MAFVWESLHPVILSIDFEFYITDVLWVKGKSQIINLILLFELAWRVRQISIYNATSTATSQYVTALKTRDKCVHVF